MAITRRNNARDDRLVFHIPVSIVSLFINRQTINRSSDPVQDDIHQLLFRDQLNKKRI